MTPQELKDARALLGHTLADMASHVGVRKDSLKRMEQAKASVPDRVERIIRAKVRGRIDALSAWLNKEMPKAHEDAA